MKKTNKVTLALALLALGGCKANPLPEQGKLTPEKPPVEKVVPPPYGIDVADVLEFVEGSRLDQPIVGWVPAPGKPKFMFEGLPDGVTFDEKESLLSWTPGYAAADNPADRSAEYRSYPIKAFLFSSENPKVSIQKSLILLVRNTPRDLELRFSQADFQLKEGDEFQTTVTVQSEDYPDGPFEFSVQGLPAGAVVEPSSYNPNEFEISYTPGLQDVKAGGKGVASNMTRKLPLTFTAYDPAGHKTSTQMDWTLVDARQKAVFSAPSSLSQGVDVNFMVAAEDPNGEEAPILKIKNKPSYGRLQLDDSSDGMVSRLNVRWDQIPSDKVGKTDDLVFTACVYKTAYSQTLCTDRKVSVSFVSEPMEAPVIDRSKWKLGAIRYLKVGETLRVSLPVGSPIPSNLNFTVEVNPPDLRSDVIWKNNELVITPKTAGIKQFNVTAAIVQGKNRTESFYLEALPTNWPETLIFGDGLRDPEVQAASRYFKGAQIVNPALQAIDERMLALRKTLFLGTSALSSLSDPAVAQATDEAIQRISTVVVQSPLVESLRGSFAKEIKALGLTVRGRLAQVTGPNVPALSSLPLVPARTSFLTPSQQGVFLGGRFSTESSNPLLFGFDTRTQCKPALNLEFAPVPSLPPYELLTAVSCSRSNGGKLIVTGFEWGDLQVNAVDQQLPDTWMAEIQGM